MKAPFGKWLRRRRRRKSDTAKDDYIDIKPVPPDTDDPAEASQETRAWWLHRIRPGAKREQQVAALQAGYDEVVELVEAIQDHLRNQQETQREMLKQLPAAVDGLHRVAESTRRQTEALDLIHRQLKESGDRDRRLLESMTGFKETMQSLAESSQSSEKLMRDMIERTEQRMILLVGVIMVLVLLVLGVAVYFGKAGATEGLIDSVQGMMSTETPAAPAAAGNGQGEAALGDWGENDAAPASRPAAR